VRAPIKIPRQRGPLAVIVGLKSKTASGWRGLWPERASAALHWPAWKRLRLAPMPATWCLAAPGRAMHWSRI
jgi:hypothetical protein